MPFHSTLPANARCGGFDLFLSSISLLNATFYASLQSVLCQHRLHLPLYRPFGTTTSNTSANNKPLAPERQRLRDIISFDSAMETHTLGPQTRRSANQLCCCRRTKGFIGMKWHHFSRQRVTAAASCISLHTLTLKKLQVSNHFDVVFTRLAVQVLHPCQTVSAASFKCEAVKHARIKVVA